MFFVYWSRLDLDLLATFILLRASDAESSECFQWNRWMTINVSCILSLYIASAMPPNESADADAGLLKVDSIYHYFGRNERP